MSMTNDNYAILSGIDFDAPHLYWIAGLARYTRQRREELGLTVERAAELAGMEASEWYALESGWAPNAADMAKIQAIAATL